MCNGKGFELEEMCCEECSCVFLAAPNDPTDKCECPNVYEHVAHGLSSLAVYELLAFS